MTGGIYQYILSIVCASLFCAILRLLFHESSGMASVMKLITALTLSITVITPLIELDLNTLDYQLDSLLADSVVPVKEGEEVAQTTMSQLIKGNTEAYIVEKAAALGLTIQANVELTEEQPPTPTGVTIKGAVAPYMQEKFSAILEQDLGIAEENQIWIS